MIQEAKTHKHQIKALCSFSYHDPRDNEEKGKGVREKAKYVLELLKSDKLIKAERKKAKELRGKFSGISSEEMSGGRMNQYSGGYDDEDASTGRYAKTKKKSKKPKKPKKAKKQESEMDDFEDFEAFDAFGEGMEGEGEDRDEDSSSSEEEVKPKKKKKKKKAKKEEEEEEDEFGGFAAFGSEVESGAEEQDKPPSFSSEESEEEIQIPKKKKDKKKKHTMAFKPQDKEVFSVALPKKKKKDKKKHVSPPKQTQEVDFFASPAPVAASSTSMPTSSTGMPASSDWDMFGPSPTTASSSPIDLMGGFNTVTPQKQATSSSVQHTPNLLGSPQEEALYGDLMSLGAPAKTSPPQSLNAMGGPVKKESPMDDFLSF